MYSLRGFPPPPRLLGTSNFGLHLTFQKDFSIKVQAVNHNFGFGHIVRAGSSYKKVLRIVNNRDHKASVVGRSKPFLWNHVGTEACVRC
jgi:hypothetical protein